MTSERHIYRGPGMTRVLLVTLAAGVALAAADMVWALLDAASIDAPPRLHNPIVAPVQVTVDYAGERSVPPPLVERISPRGIASALEGRESFFARASVFADVRVSAESVIWDEVRSVALRVGDRTLEATGAQLRAAALQGEDGVQSVSLRDAFAISRPGSFLPRIGSVFNYRGDLTVIFWLFLRTLFGAAAIVGLWRLHASAFFRDPANAAKCFTSSWVVFGILALLLAKSWMERRPVIVSDVASAVYLGVLICVVFSLAQLLYAFGRVDHHRGMGRSLSLRGSDRPLGRSFWAIAALAVILAAAFRLWNIDYLQGADSFNLTAALALNDTGSFAYARNLHLTHAFGWLLQTFGASLTSIRVPLVLVSLGVMAMLPLLSRPFGAGVILVSLVLYATSPVAIEHASTIREYGENLLVATVFLAILTIVFLRLRQSPRRAAATLTLSIVVGGLLIYGYARLVNNVTVVATIQVAAFYVVALCAVLLWGRVPERWPRVAIVFGLAAGFVGLVAMAPRLGPFETELWLPTNFLRVYFDPFVDKPMQWFSYQAVTPVVPAVIVLAAIAKRRNRDLGIAMSLAFWGSLLLFALRMGDTSRSRYVYHLFPLYLVLFSSGLHQVWWAVREAVSSVSQRRGFLLAFLVGTVVLVWPVNTVIAARHSIPEGQARWVTSLRHDDYVRDLHELLRENGLSPRKAVVLERERPDSYCWVMDRPITETYAFSYYDNVPYDIAQGLYYHHPDWGAYGLQEGHAEHGHGFYLLKDRPGRIPEVKVGGTRLSFVTSAHGFTIYRW